MDSPFLRLGSNHLLEREDRWCRQPGLLRFGDACKGRPIKRLAIDFLLKVRVEELSYFGVHPRCFGQGAEYLIEDAAHEGGGQLVRLHLLPGCIMICVFTAVSYYCTRQGRCSTVII